MFNKWWRAWLVRLMKNLKLASRLHKQEKGLRIGRGPNQLERRCQKNKRKDQGEQEETVRRSLTCKNCGKLNETVRNQRPRGENDCLKSWSYNDSARMEPNRRSPVKVLRSEEVFQSPKEGMTTNQRKGTQRPSRELPPLRANQRCSTGERPQRTKTIMQNQNQNKRSKGPRRSTIKPRDKLKIGEVNHNDQIEQREGRTLHPLPRVRLLLIAKIDEQRFPKMRAMIQTQRKTGLSSLSKAASASKTTISASMQMNLSNKQNKKSQCSTDQPYSDRQP